MIGQVVQSFDLDFASCGSRRRDIHVTQYSAIYPILVATLYNENKPYVIPSGATVRVRWKKPTGTVVYEQVTAFTTGGDDTAATITYQISSQCLTAFGDAAVNFEITLSGKKIQTPAFIVHVCMNPVQEDDIEDSSTDLSSIPELTALVETATTAASSATASQTAAASSATSAAASATAAQESVDSLDIGLSVVDGAINITYTE